MRTIEEILSDIRDVETQLYAAEEDYGKDSQEYVEVQDELCTLQEELDFVKVHG